MLSASKMQYRDMTTHTCLKSYDTLSCLQLLITEIPSLGRCWFRTTCWSLEVVSLCLNQWIIFSNNLYTMCLCNSLVSKKKLILHLTSRQPSMATTTTKLLMAVSFLLSAPVSPYLAANTGSITCTFRKCIHGWKKYPFRKYCRQTYLSAKLHDAINNMAHVLILKKAASREYAGVCYSIRFTSS